MITNKVKIGIDEAGRGCLAGPVVACSLALNYSLLPSKELLEQIDDSKKLTPVKREKIFKLLIKEANKKNPTLFFGIGVVDNQEIDRTNIRLATQKAMQRALDELSLKIDLKTVHSVLVDGRDNFSFAKLGRKPIFIIDGDAKVKEIQAASILAKVFRDHLMRTYDLLYPQLFLAEHKGYGTKKHTEAISDRQHLSGIHRFTYQPVTQILNKKPRLLIHVCCGPDASIPFLDLKEKYEISAFWYDPNIQPKKEYEKRLKAFKKVCALEKIEFIEGEYDLKAYFKAVKGLEHLPEKSERCERCFDFRLKRSVQEAKKRKCQFWTTTLTISPHKDAEKINKMGLILGEKYGLKYLPFIFRKNNGFLRSIEYCQKNKIYRQNYCGCVFSMKGKDGESKLKTMISVSNTINNNIGEF